uniref:Uncharacterized protein n=1 Tax=Arundo donax TaxID=35708 RepID=A0A0A9A3K3_ARUDO
MSTTFKVSNSLFV